MSLRALPTFRSIRTFLALAVVACLVAVPPVPAQGTDDLPAVLITGTSSGIGLRMTEVLSQNGFFVYAGARKPADLERLDAMENVKSVRLDVTIQSEIDAAAAGVAVMGPLIERSEQDMEFQLDVNLFGPYRVTKAFADLLIENEGRVLTVSSIAGILSGPYIGAYSMSKHGVEAYTDALAAELERFDVQVAAVEPGNYKSQITASMLKRMDRTGYSAEGSRYGSMRDLVSGPLDRSQYQEPDDVALAALHFLTSDSPKRRYMVVPNQFEAEITIRQALREMVQLNEGQQFSYSRDELVTMLDQALGNARPSSSAAAPGAGIHEAVIAGDMEAVGQHIATGSDLNEREPMGGSSPLMSAATFGQTDVAVALIEAGADLDQQNNDGSTALLTAAFFCRTEIVEALLAAGADRSIPNYAGSTALDVVTVPFEALEPTYDFLGSVLAPYGLKLDYDRIRQTRPVIADMLR